MNPEHKIAFDDTELICNTQHYYPRLHREAIEIYKHKNNFKKKEEGLKVLKTWYPALKMCKVKPLITKTSKIETDQSGQDFDRATSLSLSFDNLKRAVFCHIKEHLPSSPDQDSGGRSLLTYSFIGTAAMAANMGPSIADLVSQFLALPEEKQKEVSALMKKATEEKKKTTSAEATAKAKESGE